MTSSRWVLALIALTFGSCGGSKLGGSGTGGSPATGGSGGSISVGTGGVGTGGVGTGGVGTGGVGTGGVGTGGSATGGTAGTTTADAGRDAQVDGGRSCRPSTPCPTGWYLYSDHVCGPPRPDGGSSCSPVGDGLCYQPCTSSGGCTDPHTPNCTALYIFNGSDYGHPMTVCTSNPPLPACSTPDAGHSG